MKIMKILFILIIIGILSYTGFNKENLGDYLLVTLLIGIPFILYLITEGDNNDNNNNKKF